MNKKNILVGQSGGPTAVINGSLYGVICEGARHSDAVGCVYGMINGIEGFLADSYMNLSETLSDDDLELLRLTPAAYLGSCRFKLPERFSGSLKTAGTQIRRRSQAKKFQIVIGECF